MVDLPDSPAPRRSILIFPSSSILAASMAASTSLLGAEMVVPATLGVGSAGVEDPQPMVSGMFGSKFRFAVLVYL